MHLEHPAAMIGTAAIPCRFPRHKCSRSLSRTSDIKWLTRPGAFEWQGYGAVNVKVASVSPKSATFRVAVCRTNAHRFSLQAQNANERAREWTRRGWYLFRSFRWLRIAQAEIFITLCLLTHCASARPCSLSRNEPTGHKTVGKMAIKTTRNITQPNTHTHWHILGLPIFIPWKKFCEGSRPCRIVSHRRTSVAMRDCDSFCHFYAHQPLYIGAHTCGDARWRRKNGATKGTPRYKPPFTSNPKRPVRDQK